MNASYLVNEDRVLFRFNTQDQSEYRLWLTRRVTLFILAASSHLLAINLEKRHSPDAAKALNEFEREALFEATKTANAGAQTYESGVHFPIGFDPLLVMDVTCSLVDEGKTTQSKSPSKESVLSNAISVDFALPGGANLNLQLPENMMRAMSVLLDQLRQQAGWGEVILSIKKMNETTSKNDVDNDGDAPEKSVKNISLH